MITITGYSRPLDWHMMSKALWLFAELDSIINMTGNIYPIKRLSKNSHYHSWNPTTTYSRRNQFTYTYWNLRTMQKLPTANQNYGADFCIVLHTTRTTTGLNVPCGHTKISLPRNWEGCDKFKITDEKFFSQRIRRYWNGSHFFVFWQVNFGKGMKIPKQKGTMAPSYAPCWKL